MNAENTSQINTLNDWQLAVFTAAHAERLFPNFALFASVIDSVDADALRIALNKVWDHVCQRGNCNTEAQLLRVEEQTPDVEQYDMYGVYPALDAAVAVAAALEQLDHPSIEEALNINQLVEESIASYLEIIADPSLSDEELVRFINTHELMDQHISFTDELLEQLTALETPKASVLDALRDMACNEGVSHIGICVDE